MENLNRLARRDILLGAAAATALSAAPKAFAQNLVAPMGIRRGQTSVRGKTVAWRAETGETVMRNAEGQSRATIFAVAYTAEGANPAKRPVSFIWNGGPGGATWPLREHLSPRITAAVDAAAHYAFVDNPDSLIDATDLVFIDAPGTGFSRVLDPSANPEYWGVEEDGRAFSDFIAGWLKSHKRLKSPIFLIGESYGGTRTGQVVRNLAAQKIELTGVTLVSPTLGPPNGKHSWFGQFNRAYSMPPLACIAWYHKRGAHTAKTLEEVGAEALAFAEGPYAAAISKGNQIDETEKARIAEQLAGFIGLPVDEILKANLSTNATKFRTELLADEKRTIERDDGRQSQPTPPPGETAAPPSRPYDQGAAIEGLIREDLRYRPTGTYDRSQESAINKVWDNDVRQTGDTAEILKERLTANPKLRVFLAGGYFDTAVPFPLPLTEMTATLPPARLDHKLYPSGHAVYADAQLRPQSTDDLRAFYKRQLS